MPGLLIIYSPSCPAHPQGIDVKSMGRIFIGLVKCGAWGCFDEFNRLEEAVLSAVSMQIQTIQAAIRNRAPACELLDRQVSLCVCVCVCVCNSTIYQARNLCIKVRIFYEVGIRSLLIHIIYV